MRKVLFLGCNYAQIPYLKEVKKNHYVIGTDLNKNAPGIEFCDKFYNVGYLSYEELIEVVKAEQFTADDYVFTAAEQFAYLGVSAVSEYLGKQWLTQDTVDLILNKQLFYEYFGNNAVPYPETKFITTPEDLEMEIKALKPNANYYLKSDRSKNPLHIYRFNTQNVDLAQINWQKDRFLVNGYVLQEEFVGEYYRVNLIKDSLFVFDFSGNRLSVEIEDRLSEIGIIQTLIKLNHKLSIHSFIVKYDVLVSGKDFVVLDIGIDHPSRLAKYYNNLDHDFAQYYVSHYLLGSDIYPRLQAE